ALQLISGRDKPREFHAEGAPDGSIRRLSLRVELDLLYRAARACRMAIEPPSTTIAEDRFIDRARQLGVAHEPPSQILFGRALLEGGFEAGREMGELLKKVYELQLDGSVTTLDEAMSAARGLSGGQDRR